MFYAERTWAEIEDLTERVVVLPLGSLEQHGHHLPMLTDTMIAAEIVKRAEQVTGDEALFLPVLWIGASDHHLGFTGTVSAGNSLYSDLLIDIIESLVTAGFRKIFLLNAHGGNITPGRMAIYDVQMRHQDLTDLFIAFSSWWTIAAEQIASVPDLDQKIVTHACELETSMILKLRPELVNLEVAAGSTIPFESAFYVPDFSAYSRVDVPKAFDQLSVTGAFGHPELATALKGEHLFDVAVHEITSFIREFQQWTVIDPK